MKILLSFSLIISIILLASCEGNTDVFVEIVNGSSEQLVINAGNNSDDFIYANALILAVGETVQVGSWSQRGGNPNAIEISQVITTMSIKQQNTNLELDSLVYLDDNRWGSQIEERSKVPSDYKHKYTLRLFDADFQ
jgi:uncharacterized protein (UPF0333 family)